MTAAVDTSSHVRRQHNGGRHMIWEVDSKRKVTG